MDTGVMWWWREICWLWTVLWHNDSWEKLRWGSRSGTWSRMTTATTTTAFPCGQYGDDHCTFTISYSHNNPEKSEGIIVPTWQRRGSQVMRVLTRAIWLWVAVFKPKPVLFQCLPLLPHWSPLSPALLTLNTSESCAHPHPTNNSDKANTFLRPNGVSSRYRLEFPVGIRGKARTWTVLLCQGALIQSIRKRPRACTLAGPSYLHWQSLLGKWQEHTKHFVAPATMILPWIGVGILNGLQFFF